MKIAFIPATFLPIIGGAEIQTHNLANKLEEKNIKVDVWNLNEIKIKNNKYNIKKFNHFLINLIFIFKYYLHLDLSFLLEIYVNRIIKKYKYDIWHFHSLNYKLLLIINILKKNKQKIIITLQGADIQINKEINYGYRLDFKFNKLFLKMIDKADYIHAISKEIENLLLNLNIKKKKIINIPNSIPLKKFYKKNRDNNEMFTLITVARNATLKKGYDFVELIAKELILKCNFKWKIIGRKVEILKENKFIKKNITYFDFIKEIKIDEQNEKYYPPNELIHHFKNSNLYLHLSRIESFGVTIIEAMASGLPIIAFNTPGANEIVQDNLNGYLIEPYNIEKYVEKILFLKNNYLNNKFNNEEYLTKFDLEFTSDQFIFLYEKLLNDK